MNGYIEEDIFQAALDTCTCRNNIVIPIRFEVVATEQVYNNQLRIDKVLQMEVNNKIFQFCVEIKNSVTKANIGLIVQQMERLPNPLLLVANHINEFMAEHLKENKIEFIDTAGNAYINQPPLYIFVKGNKPNEKFRNVQQGQAFRPTGLRVIFTFLCYPDFINKTYRDIARAAGVALGNIGWVITDLKNNGFILDMGKRGRKLVQKEQLLNRFVEEYPKRLRQQLLIGRYTGQPDWYQEKNIRTEYALWGGELAAAKLTKYLKPQNITVYIKHRHLNDFLLQNRLKKDIYGEIEILKYFWEQTDLTANKDLVPPILIYADLMATANQRNIESAKVIYEQYIVRHIGEA
ncbi:MAG: hypothetical protein GY777_02255 [Candidatus Brocadiaceae bacterium]|nr:hypothetical protein [Candidatus Brocadiaceae bacterium]